MKGVPAIAFGGRHFPPFVSFHSTFHVLQARSENLPDKTADGPLANPLEEGGRAGREGGGEGDNAARADEGGRGCGAIDWGDARRRALLPDPDPG